METTTNTRPDEAELQSLINAVVLLPADIQQRLADAIPLARMFSGSDDKKSA